MVTNPYKHVYVELFQLVLLTKFTQVEAFKANRVLLCYLQASLAAPFHTALLENHFLDLARRPQLDLLGFARSSSLLRQDWR